MAPQHLGDFLRDMRENQGVSQGEILRRLGIKSHNHCSRVENGRTSLQIETVQRYANALGFRLDLNFSPLENENEVNEEIQMYKTREEYLRKSGHFREPRDNSTAPDLGPELKALRHYAGLSEAEMAHKLGWDGYGIYKIENDRKWLNMETLARYAAACGYDVQIDFIPQKK